MGRAASTKGICSLCQARVTKAASLRHLHDCLPAHMSATGKSSEALLIRVGAAGTGAYWLDVAVRADARLADLDRFLRDIWLECCGHLSSFSIPPFTYASPGGGGGWLMDRSSRERSMRTPAVEAFGASPKGTYDYDFGSTTRLTLEVKGECTGALGRSKVRLLVRNEPIPWTCAECGAPATAVCCVHESEDSPFVCAEHERAHPCEDEAFLPVVNSPRMGVCGYAG